MLDNNKKQIAIKSKIICLNKYIANIEMCNEGEAYKKLLNTHLFKLLVDPKTGLYLESVEYIINAYEIEKKQSKEAMVAYISKGN